MRGNTSVDRAVVVGSGDRPHPGHAHKYPTSRAHRHAHRLQRLETERARIRAIARHPQRRPVVFSEWLGRSPILGHESAIKRGGAKFGPAPVGVGLPGTQAAPLLGTQRLLNYARQTGRITVDHIEQRCATPLTPRQMRRALKKSRAAKGRAAA